MHPGALSIFAKPLCLFSRSRSVYFREAALSIFANPLCLFSRTRSVYFREPALSIFREPALSPIHERVSQPLVDIT
jgi:hypothetical protein